MAENTNKPGRASGGIVKDALAFRAGANKFRGPDINLAALAPKAEPEPEVVQGIDLSGQPKIVLAVGRGKTGKTTLLRWLAEVAAQSNSQFILADIDPTNSSFSRYFDNVAQPDTDSPAGVTRWLQALLDHCLQAKQSAIIDLGGGDTTLRTLATEMPGMAAVLEAAGIAPVLLNLVGAQPEDLTPSFTLRERGFSPKAQAFILNEFAIEPGLTRSDAFGRVLHASSFQALSEGNPVIWMPKLFPADEIEARSCGFFAARDGQVTPRLGMFDAARVRIWLDTMARRFDGIKSWIP